MAQTVTLGGDRLGSGKKQRVELHGFERSTHDLSFVWRSTMAAGTLVPFLSLVGLPGDTFDINLNSFINTHPTVGPLFGSYKAQYDVFSVPIRLYNALLHNNKLNVGKNMAQVKLPQIRVPVQQNTEAKDLDNSQINPSCILKYLGISGGGYVTDADVTRDFNAVPLMAVWDIYKNYYANKNEGIGAVIHTVAGTEQNIINVRVNGLGLPMAVTGGEPIAVRSSDGVVTNLILQFQLLGDQPFTGVVVNTLTTQQPDGTFLTTGNIAANTVDTIMGWTNQGTQPDLGAEPQVYTFPLTNIDTVREQMLKHDGGSPFLINFQTLAPYGLLCQGGNGYNNVQVNQQGLPVKTYQSDLFNNWLDTESIVGQSGINEISAVSTAGGQFTIEALTLAKKVYDMLNRVQVSGGSYDDWLTAVYDHNPYTRAYSPIYMGGLSKELIFEPIVSQAQAGDTENQPLGTLAGMGKFNGKHKGGSIYIKCDEPCYIIGLVSLTPRIDYSQGNTWDVNLKTMDDLHKPSLDQIGFQDLITEQMAHWDTHWDENTGEFVQKSAGKQPAWVNYMTAVNKTYGNFAIQDNEMFMTLNRRYEPDELKHIKDLTTYVDPAKYNYIFAETSRDAQNFWMQIGVDVTARRKMSAKVMPNL